MGNFNESQDDPIKDALRRMAVQGSFLVDMMKRYQKNVYLVQQKPIISIDINQSFVCFTPVEVTVMDFNFPIDSVTFDFNTNRISVYEADGSLLITIEVVDKDHFRVYEYAGWLRYGEGWREREHIKTKEEWNNELNIRSSFIRGQYYDDTKLYYFRGYLGK